VVLGQPLFVLALQREAPAQKRTTGQGTSARGADSPLDRELELAVAALEHLRRRQAGMLVLALPCAVK